MAFFGVSCHASYGYHQKKTHSLIILHDANGNEAVSYLSDNIVTGSSDQVIYSKSAAFVVNT